MSLPLVVMAKLRLFVSPNHTAYGPKHCPWPLWWLPRGLRHWGHQTRLATQKVVYWRRGGKTVGGFGQRWSLQLLLVCVVLALRTGVPGVAMTSCNG